MWKWKPQNGRSQGGKTLNVRTLKKNIETCISAWTGPWWWKKNNVCFQQELAAYSSHQCPNLRSLKSGLKILRCWILLLNTWSLPDGPCWKSKSVSAAKRPLFSFWAAAAPSPKSLPNPGAYSNWNIFMWSQGFPEPPVFYLFLRW